jgi:hypothetical protein
MNSCMKFSPRSIVLGTSDRKDSRLRQFALVLCSFLVAFGGYALGVFSVSGGILLIPVYAAIVGVLAAFWVGYSSRGLLLAWVVAYTPMLGFHVEDALLTASEQSIGERVTDLAEPEAFVVLGGEAMIFGTLAFAVGYLLQGGFSLVQDRSQPTLSGKHD